MSKPGNTPPTTFEQTLRALVAEVVRDELARMKLASSAADEYMKVAEAAAYASVAPATISKWIRMGRLMRYSAGADPRVKRSDLERALRTKPKATQLTPEQMARRDFG